MVHCTPVLPDAVISLYYYCIAVKKYFFFHMLRLNKYVFFKSDVWEACIRRVLHISGVCSIFLLELFPNDIDHAICVNRINRAERLCTQFSISLQMCRSV